MPPAASTNCVEVGDDELPDEITAANAAGTGHEEQPPRKKKRKRFSRKSVETVDEVEAEETQAEETQAVQDETWKLC